MVSAIAYKRTKASTDVAVNVTIECDDSKVVVGGDLTCYVKGAADYEVKAFKGKIKVDNKLDLTNISVDTFGGNKSLDKTTGNIVLSGVNKNEVSPEYTGGDINQKFNFATFVVSGKTIGNTTITLENVEVTKDYNEISLENASIAIEVVENAGGNLFDVNNYLLTLFII